MTATLEPVGATTIDEAIAQVAAVLDQLRAVQSAPRASADAYGNPSNVAAGELIESAWGNAVVARVAKQYPSKTALDAYTPPNGAVAVTTDTSAMWVRKGGIWQPPPGTVVGRGHKTIADMQSGVTGNRSIASFGAGTWFPYPTVMHVTATVYFGYGTVTINAFTSIYADNLGTVVTDTNLNQVQALAFCWAAVPQTTQWAIPAGNTQTGQVFMNVTSLASGVVHNSGDISWFYVVT